MSQINVRNLSNENDDGAPDIVGVSTFSATSYIVPPVGNTAQRPENPQPGDLRFNTDSASLEYFRGNTIGWEQIEMTSPDLNSGSRGVWAGGNYYPVSPQSACNVIEYVTIPTLGNAVDFGDTSQSWKYNAGCASRTRGVTGGGIGDSSVPAYVNIMEYITIASTGNATDFGDTLSDNKIYPTCFSSQTRGLWVGGGASGSKINTIGYVTIATTGNCADFGDTTQARSNSSGCSSSTRGVYAGGYTPTNVNTIDYYTIATTGNGQDFGDLTQLSQFSGGSASSTRGLFWGGVGSHPVGDNTIDYITIATTGNATDFGDSVMKIGYANNFSSTTRSVRGGGQSPNTTNVIEYVQIATTGNAKDFGDLSTTEHRACGCFSNGHGGL